MRKLSMLVGLVLVLVALTVSVQTALAPVAQVQVERHWRVMDTAQGQCAVSEYTFTGSGGQLGIYSIRGVSAPEAMYDR
jgi:hypothetical protein